MTELTLDEATAAVNELKDVLYWERLVSFIKEHYPANAAKFRLGFDSEYNDVNYYDIITDIMVYDEENKRLYPRPELVKEAMNGEVDPDQSDEYEWDDVEHDYLHDLLYDAGFKDEENGVPLKKEYSMTEPPETRFTKLFGE